MYESAGLEIALDRLGQWQRLELEGLTAAVFFQLPIHGDIPNFEDGGEIEFGFRRLAPLTNLADIRHGIDNWTVTIHRR